MLDHKKRWIFYYKNFLRPRPDDAPYTSMRDILNKLQSRCDQGECVKLLENNTAAIRLKEIIIDDINQIAVLLFQYSDTKISDPAFVDLEKGTLRVEPKLEGEGVAISAHMVLSLKPEHIRGATYLTLLEDVPGIGKTKIEPFLTSEFKAVFDDRYPNYEGKYVKYRPTFEMNGYLAESLKDGLDKGYINGFELKKFSHVDGGLDEEGYVKVESHAVKLKTVRKFEGDEAIGVIDRMKERAKRLNYSELVVQYQRKEGKSKSIPVSTAREDAGDALFSKFEIISVLEPLPQCLSEIRKEVASKMSALLIDSR